MRRFARITLLCSLVTALLVAPVLTVAQEPEGGSPEMLGVTVLGVTGPWEPQTEAAFSPIARTGAGTVFRARKAGLQWVHIAVPVPYMLENNLLPLVVGGFCAKATNPAVSRPVKMAIWRGGKVLVSKTISWAPNTGVQCFTHSFTPPVLATDLTISVQLQFANATDKITLARAEIGLRHD